MKYYGIRNRQTGELARQFYGKNAKGNISTISIYNIDDPLSVHIFLTKNKNAALSIINDGYSEYNGEIYKLDDRLKDLKEDLEIYESEFNL
ncbi:MAG: hypothetical protein M0Z57_03180 [Deltaproteobacteria bacterium]|jgi:hypothetical protein|uniref:Uncharacterized protein n=1 Tax=Candidatus Acidulodesulfobacterium acidiphilum TaxID=2597224 RepID=A0A520XB94_9DELT|nr:hypothetical protein [Deltaproteobacteria bacterium]RZV38402.1 MAG: hypothetical protein EVJ48_07070 [Candidatus Acidulodesulfobacterium acidiphilum]